MRKKSCLAVVFLSAIIYCTMPGDPLVCSAAMSPPKAPANFRGKKKSDTNVKLKWTRQKGVSYAIFQWNSKGKYYEQAFSNYTKKGSCYVKGLKPGHIYKFRISAVKKYKGSPLLGEMSYKVSVITDSKKSRRVNAGRVKIKNLPSKISKGARKRAKAQVLPEQKGKKVISRKVYWSSSNGAVASVNSKGKVTARKKGKCYIIARAHNGLRVRKRIKVKR